jgi:hypothetical protein
MKLFLSCFAALAIAFHGSAYAQSTDALPAVDGVNGKLSFAGLVDGPDVQNISGAVSFPLGQNMGLQIDGYAANVDLDILGGFPVYGGAAHLFWRDPTQGLIGLYTDAIHFDVLSGYTVFNTGVEASLYLDRFSIDGALGYTYGDVRDEDVFSQMSVSYYPTDNLSLYLGHGYAHGQNSVIYGAEWAFANQRRTASSFFAKGSVSEDGDHIAEIGVTIYFGQNRKPLLRRHREDDPAIRVQLQPLISKAPLIGGLTIYFLELPEFDVDVPNIVNVLDIDPRRVALCIQFGC